MTAQQLKNSILQMAVQGKLVPQDPNDEPASVLLERIRAEKEQLIKEKKIKKEKNPSVIFRGADNLPYEKVGNSAPVYIGDKIPFEIPDSWEWVRHNNLFEVSGGSQPPKSKFISEPREGYIRLYQIRDYGPHPVPVYIPRNTASKTSKKGDILLARYGASLGKVFWAEDGAYNVAMAKVIPFYKTEWICKEYLYLFYQSELYQSLIHTNSRSAQAGFNKDDLNDLFFPVPPYEEQKRIVQALSAIEPILEDYRTAEDNLYLLNTTFPEQLKKSILQQAVQGKLVPQDPTEEPADVLLARIREEKAHLVKEGKIKKDKHESVIFRRDNSHYEKLDGVERCVDDEIPFEIPDSWVWARLGQVISLLSGTDFKPEEYSDTPKGTPYITGASSLSENGVLLNRWTETPRVIANRGDVLLVCKGSGYGKTVICDIEEAHIARQIMAIKKFITLDMNYVRLFLQANFDQIKSKGQGVIPGIDRSSVMSLLFPIPPLDEQHRIIEKIEELLPLLKGL